MPNPPNQRHLLVVVDRYVRDTGVMVSILDSTHPEYLGAKPEQRWVVRCSEHDCRTSLRRLVDARSAVPRPSDWCPACAEIRRLGLRLCQACRSPKPPDQFYGRSEGSKKSLCIPCYCDRTNEYRIKSTFGLTTEQYAAMLAEQEGGCAICRRPERKQRNGRPIRLAVDHDHRTGQVRALLCDRCNRFLGAMDDDPDLIEAAALYLRSHRSRENPIIVPGHPSAAVPAVATVDDWAA